MQQALPNKTRLPSTTTTTTTTTTTSTTTAVVADPVGLLQSQEGDTSNNSLNTRNEIKNVGQLVSENAVIVFGQRGCCMCHVVKRLLLGLGVNPTIFHVDEADEATVTHQLSTIIGCGDGGMPQFPAVFVGGKLFGGLERVMATHISGELVPILKDAGALWL